MSDAIDFVNARLKDIGCLHHLYELKMINGCVWGRIDKRDEEVFWLPIHLLSVPVEKYINLWIASGEEI